MTRDLPRLATVATDGPNTIVVTWRDGQRDRIDLSGWIATGGAILAPLDADDVFARATVGDHGTIVTWDGGEGDLAIDTHHLALIAAEQQPFGSAQITAWQNGLAFSDQEAADFLGVSLSTWQAYTSGAPVPRTVAMVCRAALRDPVVIESHFRPRKPGPKRTGVADPP
jgi:hypothetical protein